MKGKNVCYYCKQVGHMKWEYPLWKDKGGADKTTTNKWSFYTLSKKKSLANNELIGSMCVINQSYIVV